MPVGIDAKGKRTESDSMGKIDVPANRYWGAQTQRSLIHFSIGDERMPKAVYHAYGYVKKASALLHKQAGRMDADTADAIIQACDETIDGMLDESYPLYVYQTGSGTQSNMNVNEVISNRAIQLLGGELGAKDPVHPNDHVNMGQSSNDSFPTAMHIAMVQALEEQLFPAVEKLAAAIGTKAAQWMQRPKIGRTHLQDAVPLTVGQEWSGYEAQLRDALRRLQQARDGLYPLAAGGTAVGTGLNAPEHFSKAMAQTLAELTNRPFVTAPNKFAAQGSLDPTVAVMAALRGLAVALMKIANDLRWLGSGPRCGIGELKLPETEPGSSIMPGKVNPTVCEALVMIAIQVIGLDNAVAFAGSQGNFELNAMRPILINNVLRANSILSDGCDMFRQYTVEGTELDDATIDTDLRQSLMLVTALSPEIGYDKAAEIAHKASEEGSTLKDATLSLGYMDEDEFDRIADPKRMTGSGVSGA
jgi:fumarate hydratase class II